MKSIIPYEKDIVFETKIAEITSISLEHEEEINDEEIIGNFLISGDYKIHSISVNKTNFDYKLPYTIDLSNEIDKDSVMIDINDFTYDIKDNNTLTVKIELSLSYDELKTAEKQEEVSDAQIIDEVKNEQRLDEEIQELIEDKQEEKQELIEDKQEEKQIINDNIKPNENTYVTYHVYVVGIEDTLESICQKFSVTKETIHNFNKFEELKIGDKLLIPLEDE